MAFLVSYLSLSLYFLAMTTLGTLWCLVSCYDSAVLSSYAPTGAETGTFYIQRSYLASLQVPGSELGGPDNAT